MDFDTIRITFDPDYPTKIEIEMLENGVGIEGGQFDLESLRQTVQPELNQLIDAIKKFYNANY